MDIYLWDDKQLECEVKNFTYFSKHMLGGCTVLSGGKCWVIVGAMLKDWGARQVCAGSVSASL